jgi:L-ascorbate metabolism protein UlaG (beta-lactamase superfamily)
MKTGKTLIREIDTTKTEDCQCAFWWLGQHGFALKLGTAVCYVDAYLSLNKKRTVAPLLRPEDITNADIVLGSHDHEDHIDRKAWPEIAKASPKTKFVVPELLREQLSSELGIPLERFLGVDKGISVETAGLKITGVPAAHEFLDRDEITGFHPHIGFIIEGNGFSLYHAGDTCIYEGMHTILRQWKLDMAFLPINGRDARRLRADCIGNMTYQEAADLAGALRPGLVVPAHFEMFRMNSEDPRLFIDYMRVKYPGLAVKKPVHSLKTIVSARG